MSNIVLKNISHAYAKEKVLDQVNFSIEEGELLTLLGPSGCGKTTILRIIAGFIIPDEGTVANGEKDITAWTPESRNMGIVFQNYALFPNMSVRDNIAYGALGISESESERAVRRTAAACGYSEGAGDRTADASVG